MLLLRKSTCKWSPLWNIFKRCICEKSLIIKVQAQLVNGFVGEENIHQWCTSLLWNKSLRSEQKRSDLIKGLKPLGVFFKERCFGSDVPLLLWPLNVVQFGEKFSFRKKVLLPNILLQPIVYSWDMRGCCGWWLFLMMVTFHDDC